MLTNVVSQLSRVEQFGLWVIGAILLHLGIWAAFILRPMRLALPLGLARGLGFGLIGGSSLVRLVY